ncbi:hypothetical protein, partial [Methanolobus sp.]|uniref:hypothetical protein n=1 Tax=Methanolobus sp. TaxID=1874737 RepID=UPI0025E6BC39
MIIASAASAETVSISSVLDPIGQSDSAQVEISITDSVNVTGMDLILVYDSDVVSFISVSPNTSVASGHSVITGGSVEAITIELRDLPNLTNSGSVPVIDVVFDAVGGGTSILGLEDIVILEDGFTSTPSIVDGGSITVNSAPDLSTISPVTVSEGATVTITLEAIDADTGDTLSYSDNADYGS